jgi:hypothetical protein
MAGWQRCRLARQSRSSGRSSATRATVASCGAAAMARYSTPVSVNARGPPAANGHLLAGTVLGQRSAPSAQQATEVSARRHRTFAQIRCRERDFG